MCTRDDLVEARISGDADRRWATADGDQAYSVLAADCPYCVEGGVGVAEQDLRDASATSIGQTSSLLNTSAAGRSASSAARAALAVSNGRTSRKSTSRPRANDS